MAARGRTPSQTNETPTNPNNGNVDKPPKSERRDSDPQELGLSIEVCKLGDDCPYAGSMRHLFDERLRREQMEGQLAARIDVLADKLQSAILMVEQFRRQLLDLDFELKRHIKTHRLFELAVLALAAAAGGFLSRWLVHP